MENLGFNEKILDMTNKFYTVALKQFKFQKKIQGITVDVERVSKTSKYSKVFGGIYNSNNLDDSEVTHFSHVILLQVNDMKRLYDRNIDSLDFYDNEKVIDKGDLISYSRGNMRYQFKVSEVEAFSDVCGVLYHYTIVGLKEVELGKQNENPPSSNGFQRIT